MASPDVSAMPDSSDSHEAGARQAQLCQAAVLRL